MDSLIVGYLVEEIRAYQVDPEIERQENLFILVICGRAFSLHIHPYSLIISLS